MDLSIFFNPDCKVADIRAAIESYSLQIRSNGRTLAEAGLDLFPFRSQSNTLDAEQLNLSTHLVHAGPGANRRHPFFVAAPLRLEIIFQLLASVGTMKMWTWSQAFEPGEFYVDLAPVLTSRPFRHPDADADDRREKASR